MKRISLILATTLAVLASAGQTPARRTLFDAGWQFTHGGTIVGVDLPHDWDIYTAPDAPRGATGTGGGWYGGGKGEYTKTFATPAGERVKLHFEGVYQQAVVYVNGQRAAQHAYGYTPFTADITQYLYKDAKQLNTVTVTVDNSRQPNCRWYSGSGIYRHVWLLTMPALHIAADGVVVTTPAVSADAATVQVSVTVDNESDRRQRATVSVEGQKQALDVEPGQATATFTYTIEKPRLWSPDSPQLYTATVRLNDNEVQTVSYGVRTFSFTADGGFVLNGRPMLINGACVHHDDGVLGAMAFDAAEVRKVRQMKDAGFNLIRTSHNPPTRAFLDACDSIGMMVIDEAFDGWRTAKTTYDYSTLIDSCYRDDIHAMVRRDRNHPSIICWSIGNEVIERKDIRVITTARRLKQAVVECDATRPVTEALCAWDSDWDIYDPHFEVLDVTGYNYMMHKHADDHRRAPQRVMWQTESYPRDAFLNWQRTHDNTYIVGDIVWTGLDYLGESGIGRYYYEGERSGEHYRGGGQPDWHGAYCGDVDITGWRKPISHYRQLLWATDGEAKTYVAVREPQGYHGTIKETQWSVWPTWESWNWPGWEGKPIEVEVCTKAPWAELFVNGRSAGRKSVGIDTEYKAVFTVAYEPGTLRVVTATGDDLQLSTAGAPARLRLTADRRQLCADGQDLAFITVEVVDAQGHVVPDAAVKCDVSTSGSCRLLAAASADMKDTEPYTSPSVTTWKGRALIVVRTTQKAGQALLSVKGSGLPKSALKLTAKSPRKQ